MEYFLQFVVGRVWKCGFVGKIPLASFFCLDRQSDTRVEAFDEWRASEGTSGYRMDKVLLVDDEVDICLLLSGILQREGFHTAYALSIEEAREKLTHHGFGAVFVDLNLPDGVGYKLIPLIKNGRKDVKVIVVSAYDGEKSKAEKEGADYFIAKPFTRGMVLSALEELNLYPLPND